MSGGWDAFREAGARQTTTILFGAVRTLGLRKTSLGRWQQEDSLLCVGFSAKICLSDFIRGYREGFGIWRALKHSVLRPCGAKRVRLRGSCMNG